MSVLFVCLGNICRSPTAEAVFRDLCNEIPCDSAGTAEWHVGKPPYGPMQTTAQARGIDMSGLRARLFTAQDFDRFDLIIGMDSDNLEDIEALRPSGNTTQVALLAPFAGQGEDTVPDPYFTRDFEGAMDIVMQSVAGLVTHLREQAPDTV